MKMFLSNLSMVLKKKNQCHVALSGFKKYSLLRMKTYRFRMLDFIKVLTAGVN